PRPRAPAGDRGETRADRRSRGRPEAPRAPPRARAAQRGGQPGRSPPRCCAPRARPAGRPARGAPAGAPPRAPGRARSPRGRDRAGRAARRARPSPAAGSAPRAARAAASGCARHRRRHPPACAADEERAPWPARAWLFAVECAATALLGLATPLALRRRRVRPLEPGDPHPPVVLLHGYAQHPANFLWLARRLERDGWRHLYAVAHTPVGGDIERSARRLGETLDRVRRASGASRVDIVAHSMGGLVARAYIRARGHASGVGRLITLGTPHQGTEIFPRFRLDPMVAQMRPG